MDNENHVSFERDPRTSPPQPIFKYKSIPHIPFIISFNFVAFLRCRHQHICAANDSLNAFKFMFDSPSTKQRTNYTLTSTFNKRSYTIVECRRRSIFHNLGFCYRDVMVEQNSVSQKDALKSSFTLLVTRRRTIGSHSLAAPTFRTTHTHIYILFDRIQVGGTYIYIEYVLLLTKTLGRARALFWHRLHYQWETYFPTSRPRKVIQ